MRDFTRFVCSCLLICLMTGYAFASDFTVSDISVDIRAEDATTARDEAIRTAQQKSVPLLMQKLRESGYSQEQMRVLTPETLRNAVLDFELKNEQISPTRYKANFTFRYDQNAIDRILGIGYFGNFDPNAPWRNINNAGNQKVNPVAGTDISTESKALLVLPFLQVGNMPLKLWAQPNLWLSSWSQQANRKYVTPIGDLKDINDISDTEALTYTPEKLANMSQRYNAERAVILLATYTGAPLPDNPDNAHMGRMNIALYDTATGRPGFLDQFSVRATPGESIGGFMSRAVSKSQKILERLTSITEIGTGNSQETPQQKSVSPMTQPAQTNDIRAQISYNSMKEWIAVQSGLREMPQVKGIQILSLQPKMATVLITYTGALDTLATALREEGFGLSFDETANVYVLYLTGWYR